MNRKRVLIPALMLAFSVPGLLAAGSAQAATVTTLPISNFYQVVADPAQGHLFFSQGSSSVNDILVTNLAGAEVATIQLQNGVKGITLSPDGATLYAAVGSAHAVTAISTATLKPGKSYPLGSTNTPVDVAVQSGRIWVSYNTGAAGDAAIGDINLSAAQPAFQTQPAMGGWKAGAPELAADPRGTGVLAAAEPGTSPASVATYNTSVQPATVIVKSDSFTPCSNEGDLAVVPGGAEFILACAVSAPEPYAEYRYSTADLSQQGSYASTNWPGAVAIDANGDVAAGTADSQTSPDVYVYHQDGTTPVNVYNLASSLSNLAARGLAWSADGSKLFAVVQNSSDASPGTNTYTLRVIDYPALIKSTLSVSGPATADIGKKVTLTGSLTSGGPLAGAALTITRSVTGGTSTSTFTATTNADGGFTLADTPPALGQYTYTVAYGGTTTRAPATATHTVAVTRMTPSLTLKTGATTFTYKPTVHVRAHLGTTYTNRTVSIYAQRLGSKTRTLLKRGEVNSYGNLAVRYVAPHSVRLSAVFTGDAHYAPKTVTRTVYVRARVSESLSGHYGRRRIGRVTYWLFRRTVIMHAHATVAPDKAGQCVKFQVQEYYRHAWHANVATGCRRLNRYSRASARFRLTHADIGYHYRIRAKYVRSSKNNLSNKSAWRYLIVER